MEAVITRLFKPKIRHQPLPERDLLIVRRDMSAAFYFFCGMFAEQRNLEMIIDRRRVDRKGATPDWEKADFVVVRTASL